MFLLCQVLHHLNAASFLLPTLPSSRAFLSFLETVAGSTAGHALYAPGLPQRLKPRRQFHQKIDVCFVHAAPFSKASVQRNFLHRLHDFEKVYHPEADKSSVYAQSSTLTTCSTPWSTMSWALQVSSARLNYRAKHFHPAFTRSCEV